MKTSHITNINYISKIYYSKNHEIFIIAFSYHSEHSIKISQQKEQYNKRYEFTLK